MFRTGIAVAALLVLGNVGSAQPRPRPPIAPPIVAPAQFPLAPGVMPGSPWGPGMPFQTPSFLQPPGGSGGQLLPVFGPVGSPFGYGFGYSPFYPGFGYGYGYYGPPYPISPAPGNVEPRNSEPGVALAREFPATLVLQFPAAAEVWMDGKKVTGDASEEWTLKSPVLAMNDKHTFAVKARWTKGGKTYEANRSVTIASGERSRLFVVSGDEVKER